MQRVELCEQIRKAVPQLLRRRLVLRRRAAHRRRDEAIAQAHAVVAMRRDGMGREARAMQRRIEKSAGGVAGEGTPGAIAAVRSRCKADEHDARALVAERRHGLAPIGLVRVGALLFARDVSAIRAQLGAAFAGDDATLDPLERRQIDHCHAFHSSAMNAAGR